MPLILGLEHNVIFFGPRSNPKCQRWWADRGLIHVEDSRDNTYESMPVRTFLHRLKAVNDMIGNSKTQLANDGFAHKDELNRQQRFVESALELANIAKAQGEAGSKDAIKDAKRRRSLTVVVPETVTF